MRADERRDEIERGRERKRESVKKRKVIWGR
jgi:hypothetical protein